MRAFLAWTAALMLCLAPSNTKDTDKGDCDDQQAVSCGEHVFYGDNEDLTFSEDDAHFQDRCNVQLDCCDTLLFYANRCFKNEGRQFLKRALRSAQYEIMKLCHPNSDPEHQQRYKDMTKCNTAIWPSVHKAALWYAGEMAAVVKSNVPDNVRFCCSSNELNQRIYNASLVPECDDHARKHYKSLANDYLGEMYRYVCKNHPEYQDPEKCKQLPKLDQSGPRSPPLIDFLLKYARAMKSTAK